MIYSQLIEKWGGKMGFFDFLGGAVKSGMNAMQRQVDDAIAEEAMRLRNRSPYDLRDLIENVEKSSMKRAIIIAIGLNGDIEMAADTAKRNRLNRRNFESLVTHDRVGHTVEAILRQWKRDY
ncbi:MAG: hypothetical protein K2N07_05980 [Desulfovibrio sp.]|nr:hypothetical protein [Desulfovibrio sp.]